MWKALFVPVLGFLFPSWIRAAVTPSIPGIITGIYRKSIWTESRVP